MAIAIAAVLASLLVLPDDLDFLLGIYAFGAMLAFTIAHLSIDRAALPRARPRPPLPRAAARCGSRGGRLPMPAVLGVAAVAAAGWVSVIVTARAGAR